MDLVTEMAEEYNRRNGEKKQIQYSTEAALARSVLDEEIVSHVKKCFTKKGMKEFKLGRRKNVVTKRKDVIKIPSECIVVDENVDSLDQDEVETIEREKSCEEFEESFLDEEFEEQVPTEDELRLAHEEKIFGGYLPKVVCRLKPPRKGVSDREGRGGRNEFTKKNVPESLVLGAVDYMLACKSSRNGDKQEKLQQAIISLSGLVKKRSSRRKRINIDFDDLSDDEDEDYKAPSIYNRNVDRPDEENKRKSNRLCEKQSRVDSGEYFDDENHDLGVNQDEHALLSPHGASYVGSYTITPEFEAKFSSGEWVVASGAEMPANKQQSKEYSELCEDQTNSVDWIAR